MATKEQIQRLKKERPFDEVNQETGVPVQEVEGLEAATDPLDFIPTSTGVKWSGKLAATAGSKVDDLAKTLKVPSTLRPFYDKMVKEYYALSGEIREKLPVQQFLKEKWDDFMVIKGTPGSLGKMKAGPPSSLEQQVAKSKQLRTQTQATNRANQAVTGYEKRAQQKGPEQPEGFAAVNAEYNKQRRRKDLGYE